MKVGNAVVIYGQRYSWVALKNLEYWVLETLLYISGKPKKKGLSFVYLLLDIHAFYACIPSRSAFLILI